jgi:catechol 2,3-dioxygenase-like lactoylglutathione lyase family enzyme
VRLNQVMVGMTDVPRAEAFYTLLGLRVIVREDHYLCFECPDGHHLCLFHAGDNRRHPPWRVDG